MDWIYLDNQATTMCDPRVLEKMIPYFCDKFWNPHSRSHALGHYAAEAIDAARSDIASIIGAKAEDIIFTSGATESNNIAIKGAANFYRDRGNHIVTVCTEHKCVLETCRTLERSGFSVTYLPVGSDGVLDVERLLDVVNDSTILVSVMTVNNEIGVVQPINEIAKLIKSKFPEVIFHTDAAQAVGKIDMKQIDINNIDLMSISGHKIYGPKGVGALYVKSKPKVRLTPLFDGGGQERGIRSGTLPTPLCVGLGEACRIAGLELATESRRIAELRNWLLDEIRNNIPCVDVNGSLTNRVPGNLNISFKGVEGEGIMMGLGNIAVSSGSACTSETLEPSYVISALGKDVELSHSSIRIGIGRFTTKHELEIFLEKLIATISRLRSMSPLWEA